MASIYPRRNKDGQLIGWQAAVRKRGYPLQVRTFDSKKDAEDWAVVIESEMVRKVHVDRSKAERTTLQQAIEGYIKETAPTHKGGKEEALRLNKILRDDPKLVVHSLAALTTRHFEQYRDRRLKEVAPGSVKRELGLLHAVIETVRKSHGMVENPVADVRRPTVRDARDTRLQPGEEEKLLEACRGSKNPWLAPAVILALETAMRRGELLSLRWENVDLRRKVARLEDTKNGEARDVPLSPRAIQALEVLPRALSGDVLLITAEALKQGFERARGRAELGHIRFHDLRHEATSRLFERGWNVMKVAAVTGHKDLQSLKRYTNLRAEDLAKELG
ncbi:MAG: site-specific integrase [Rhodospirillales bacterium]|nr:site-specific integrase [Rhodospirillales bacterium]